MTFNDIVQEFQHSSYGSGSDAFLEVKNATREMITSDPDHAAIYFLVHNFARTYVILHDDEAILESKANEAKSQLLDYMTRLNTALGQGSESTLATASAIVTEYMRSKRPF